MNLAIYFGSAYKKFKKKIQINFYLHILWKSLRACSIVKVEMAS